MRLRTHLWANTTLTGTSPNPGAIAYDGTRIWVANEGTTNLISFLPASPGTQTTHSIGSVVPYSLAYDGQGYIWVLTQTGSSGLLKINASTGSIVQTISYASVYASTSTQINSLCFDGYNMWAVLTSSGASTVIVVSTFSNAITYTFTLPNAANGGITFDGQFMYVATNISSVMAFYRFVVPR